jgi:hypothetical protein
MAQLLGAKELQPFVAYSLKIYDYAYDTEKDHPIFCYLTQDVLVHSKLILKLK